VDEGISCAGCSSPPGGIHYPKDVEDILQVQPFASQWSLSLRERNNSEILQGRYRKRAYAWDYCRDTVVWEPDKSSPPPPFSCYCVNANTNLLIKVEIMINKDELSLFYPKVLKGLRKLWQERDVK